MNRTYIDELPFLEDVISSEQQNLNGGLNMIPSSESGKIKKFIRNNEYNIPFEAGMNTKQQQMMEEEQELVKQQQIYEEQQRQLQIQQMQQMQEQEEFQQYEEKRKHKKKRFHVHESECDLNCISVADHAANCIVCSKLYNNDKSLYLAIIGVMIVICVILMKKVVEK